MYGGAASRPMAWSGGGSTQVSNLQTLINSNSIVLGGVNTQ